MFGVKIKFVICFFWIYEFMLIVLRTHCLINAMSKIDCFSWNIENLLICRYYVYNSMFYCKIVYIIYEMKHVAILIYNKIIINCFLLKKHFSYTKHSISLKFAAILEFRHFKNFRHQLFLYAGSENDPHDPL